MSKTTIVVGLDGSDAGARALEFAKAQAKQAGDCTIAICYVIEWSPFSFQTAEENEQRHKRREEELSQARERVLDPAVAETKAAGHKVEGIIKHGDVADILDDVAKSHNASQITGRLVAASSAPVTIIP